MKPVISAFAATAIVGLGLAACGTTTVTVRPPATTSRPATSSPSAPSIGTRQAAPAPSSPAAPQSPATNPNVTDPWAVVSAYYGDIESGNYAQAWSMIGSGATTGQTYQQFVNGFACTGNQQLTEIGESGDQVTFDLAATNSCTGQVQHFAGTDTVQNGTIVAANVNQTG
jgi:hypothetical protein